VETARRGDRSMQQCPVRPCGAESAAVAAPGTKTLVDMASEAEAGIGEGGEWIAGAAGSGSPPPMERGVALDHVMEPVAKECYTYTRSWADGRPTTTGHETWANRCFHPPTPPST
jgi:hypothetical protein